MHDDSRASAAPSPTPASTQDGFLTAEELQAFRAQFARMAALANVAEEGDDLLQNEQFRAMGRFEIVKELGRGSYGTVYVAYDSTMSRNVAIKVAHPGTYGSEKLKQRFLREAHAAARMGHPNVVTVHEYGEADGSLYIVYQLCIGQTLAEWLAAQPDRIAPHTAVEIIRQLAKGLDHAHMHGIIHRDMKPSNIILEHCSRLDRCPQDDFASGSLLYGSRSCKLSFTPRITDFGLAHDRLGGDASLSDSLLGTIDFMSPEQVQNGSDARFPTSDVYSLGVIFYRMLTGQLPSRAESVMEILYQICSVEPPDPTYFNPLVPVDLAAICMKCLSKSPGNRYRTCQELIKDLENWQNCRVVSVRKTGFHGRLIRSVRRAPVVCSLAAAVILVSGLCLGLVAMLANQLATRNRELLSSLQAIQLSHQAAVLSEKKKDVAMQAYQRMAELSEAAERRAREQAYNSELHFAYMEFSKGQILGASRTLARMAENLFAEDFQPRFDYSVLNALLQDGTQLLSGHSGTANAVAAIPGTELTVSGGRDGQLLFHNTQTGSLAHAYVGMANSAVTSLAISPDATRIAVGWCEDYLAYKLNLVKVYELHIGNDSSNWLGRLTHQFFAPATCQSICFSPDGRRLAYGLRYQKPIIFDFESSSVVQVDCKSRHRLLSFSPDSSSLLVASKSKTARIFDAVTGAERAQLKCEDNPEVVLWSPDGRWIACCSYAHSDIELFAGTAPYHPLGRVEQARGTIEAIAFAAGGQQLVAGTKAGAVVCWDLGNREDLTGLTPVLDVVPHAGPITTLQIVRQKVVSTDDSGQVLMTPLPIQAVGGMVLAPAAMAPLYNTPGRFVAGYSEGSVKIVDAWGLVLEELLPANGCSVTDVTSSSAGLAVGWQNGRIAFRKTCSNWQDCQFPFPKGSNRELDIKDLQLSADGSFLVVCGADARIRGWKTSEPSHPLWEYGFTSNPRQLLIIGKQVVCGGMFEQIAVLDLASGELVNSLESTRATTCLMLDQQRNVLVSGQEDGRLRFHRVSDWSELGSTLHTIDQIRSLCMSPDSTCYLVGTAHGNLDVWDAEQRRIVGTLASYPDRRSVDLVEIAAGNRLLTVSFTQNHLGLRVASNGIANADSPHSNTPSIASR